MRNVNVLLSSLFNCKGSVVRGYLRHEPVTDRDPTRRKAVMGSLFQSFFTSKSDDALFNRSRSKSKESAGPAITSEMPPPPSVPLENRVSSDSDYVGSPQARLRKRQTTALVDSQRTSTKKKEEYAHDLVHEQPHHQKMGNIFIFNSLTLFFDFVEHMIMIISLYCALWTVNYLSFAWQMPHDRSLWQIYTMSPGLFSLIFFAMSIRDVALLKVILSRV